MLTGETGAGKTLLAHALDLLLGAGPGAGSSARRRGGLRGGRVRAAAGAGRRRADAGRRRGDRARPAGVARRAHPGLRVRALGHPGRPAGAGRPAAVVLRPARAPQADALHRPAGAAGRLRRCRPAARCAPAPGRLRAGARAGARAPASCASWPAPATASWTCSASSSTRSRPPRRARTSPRRWPPSATGCATRRSWRRGHRRARRRSPRRPATRRHGAAGRGGRGRWRPRRRSTPGWARWPTRLAALRYEGRGHRRGSCAAYLLDLDERGAGDGAARLEEVEERLALLARLERKHGGTLAEVLAHAERCRARRGGARPHADEALEGVAGRAGRRARDELSRAGHAAGQVAAAGTTQAGRRRPRPPGRAGHARSRGSRSS